MIRGQRRRRTLQRRHFIYRKIVGRYPAPVVFQQHLQRAMTHLPLNPVERLVLLERQDREAVTALPDWPVRNFRSRENPAPHHVSRPAHIGRSAALIGEDVLAA